MTCMRFREFSAPQYLSRGCFGYGIKRGKVYAGLHDTNDLNKPFHQYQAFEFKSSDVQLYWHYIHPSIIGDRDAAIIKLQEPMYISPSLANPICLPYGNMEYDLRGHS